MPDFNVEQESDSPRKKSMSSWVKTRLCGCCHSDGKPTNPVTLIKADTITAQPTTSNGIELDHLPANGNAHPPESRAEGASVGGDFDEIDLTEVKAPASTSHEDNGVFNLKNKPPQEPMQGTIAAGVTDMMLEDIYEEGAHEKSDPIEEPDHIDSNAVMEATDEEVENTLSRKTKAPQILAKMEGEILRVEKLESSSHDDGRKLQRSAAMSNLDALKPIDSTDSGEVIEEKDLAQMSLTKPPRQAANPFDDEEEKECVEKDDDTKYSITGSNEKQEIPPKPPTPNPSTDTILSDNSKENKEPEVASRKSPEVEISPISESEKLEPESRESESKTMLNLRQEPLEEEKILKKSGDIQETPLENRPRPKKASSTDEGLSTDDETTTSTDVELKHEKAKFQDKSPSPKPDSGKASRMYGNISSDESESESEDESLAPDQIKSPKRVSIKKNSVVITKVSIDNNNPESPSTDRSKKAADYVVLTDDEFSEKII